MFHRLHGILFAVFEVTFDQVSYVSHSNTHCDSVDMQLNLATTFCYVASDPVNLVQYLIRQATLVEQVPEEAKQIHFLNYLQGVGDFYGFSRRG